ncbi:hypothetical protein AB8A05_04205 [Tardiphaga sp. 538_B7_N1_4]|uniref:hypothetical protein n=1 Tax=Tardiphaga sp. 538_B7_N1_4 TaxID=3240778 RepID=UPI003F2735A9
MPLLAWGAWTPDVSDYEGTAVHDIQNVFPRGDGYGPFPDFAALTASLPAACRGGFYALKSDGTIVVFAATVDRLYRLNNTDYTWVPVSKVASVTISNASPAVVTYANTFAANDAVVFSTTGSLPTGLTAGTVYYVSATSLSGSSFKVSATPGGALINTSSAGSGTHSVTAIYSSLSSTAQWRFAQFNNFVMAVQANVVPQVYDLSSSTAFADLGGSPPQAAYIDIVSRFVVLSGLLSNPYRIQWSGLNATTTWTSGVNSSDYQDLPDGGIVRGVAGGDQSAIIFQDQSIRRMSYVPGSPIIFQIDRISQDKGLYAPYSIVRAGEVVFFYAGQGFHKIAPGGFPEQIGREKVDRSFLTDLDKGNLQLFMGAADPRSTRVYWAYKSISGIVGSYDKILGYDFLLDRFFPIDMQGEYLLGISQTGLTLENLDAINSNIDAMTLTLDAYATAVQPEIAQFSSTHALGFFRGANLEATLESSEQGTDGERLRVRGFRPVTDSPTVQGSITYREMVSATPYIGLEVAKNARTGRCDVKNTSTRYVRYKNRFPAGIVWTFTAGVEPDVTTEGTQ